MQGPGLLEPICVGLSCLVPLELVSPGLVCSWRLEPGTRAGGCRGRAALLGAVGCAGSGTAVPGLAAALKLIKPSARRVFLFISI